MFALDFRRYAVLLEGVFEWSFCFLFWSSKKLRDQAQGGLVGLERREDELFDLQDVVYFVRISSLLIFDFVVSGGGGGRGFGGSFASECLLRELENRNSNKAYTNRERQV